MQTSTSPAMPPASSPVPLPLCFDDLFVEHREYIVRVCHRILRNPEDAEDAAQLAFLKAWRAMEDFKLDAHPRTWLHRIAVNESLSIIRWRRSRIPETSLDELQERKDESTPMEFGDPDPSLEMVLLLIDIERGMERIDRRQREALQLFVEGRSMSEIAVLLGASLAAAKSVMHEGRRNMRCVLGRREHD